MIYKAKLSAIALLALAATACGDGSVTVRTEGRKFRIPKEYAVNSIPFWLPRLRRDEFLFVLNPRDEISKHITVSGEPKKALCASPRTDYARMLCTVPIESIFANFDDRKLRRIDEAYGVTWRYELPANSVVKNRPFAIAACSPIERTPKDGLCHSDGFFDGLAYTIGFRESRLSDLPGLHQKVQAKLREWAVRT
jgi:hypothetical protein